MAAVQELEHVIRLLDNATSRYVGDVPEGNSEHIASVGANGELVAELLVYPLRTVVGGERLLTGEVTKQPIIGYKERKGGKVTPLAYPEDILRHPLSDQLVGTLEALNIR